MSKPPDNPMHPDLPLEVTHRVRDNCLCLHTQRAARALARRFDSALAPVGLTSGQFSILMALNRPEPPTLGPVAQLLAMDRTTLTANLKPLERRGLTETLRDPKDGRNRRLRLTDAGREILIRAMPVWEDEIAAIGRSLGGIDPRMLVAGLVALAAPPAP